MKRTALLILLWVAVVIAPCALETIVAEELASPPPKKVEKKAEDQSPLSKFMGGGKGAGSSEPTTTEIFADEAFFDSSKSTGIFRGHVKVVDSRFNLQSDKLTVLISKGENQGLEKAIAEGNVGVVRDRPNPNGSPPTRAVGRADLATYVAATGDVELKGTPRVQQGENTHIATSPDTVMIINQSGQLTTHGPSRTDIHQRPKEGDDQEKTAGKAHAGGESPKPTPKP